MGEVGGGGEEGDKNWFYYPPPSSWKKDSPRCIKQEMSNQVV